MNGKAYRLLSFALVLTVTASCFAAGGAARGNAASSDAGSQTEVLEEADAIAEAASGMLPSHGGEEGKEETVYVIADASGQPTRRIVSVWLKNPKQAATITDRTNLENIQNTKGDEDYAVDEAGDLVWAANGNDIYYQGDSQEELPLTVHVSYTLDGQPVSPDELAGASGRLVMTFTYENNTRTTKTVDGESVAMYQPFAAVSCAVLDGAKASNVEVTNGRLINLGEQLVVAGLAMPGLKESLGLDALEDPDGNPVDVDIPEEVVVSADVTDFSLLTTLTIAENSLLNGIDMEDVNSFDELEDSMDELADASAQLTDGTSELYDGTAALADGADSLSVGAIELSDGASTIADNMEDLYNGLLSLQNGASTLASGLYTLETQVQGLPAGTAALSSGAQTLKTALEEQVKPGAASLQAGAQTVSDTLRNDFVDGAAAIQTGAEAIAMGAGGISAAAAQVKEGLSNLEDPSEQVGQAAAALSGAGSCNAAAEQQLEALLGTEGITEEQAAAINAAIAQIQGSDQYLNAVMTGLGGLTIPDTSAAIGAMDQIAAGAAQIAAGAMSGSAEQPGIYEAAGALAAGAESLAAEGTDVLAAGAGQLSAGVDAMVSGNDGNNLNALIEGLNTMSGSSQKLVDGVGQLSDGAYTLKQGAGTAAAGAGQLSAGANTLASGTQTLKSGTQELSDGIGQVMDGASELMDGMSEFNEEGIQTLSQLVKDDAQGFFDRLRALQDYAEEYTSFSGCTPGTTSTVRFVIRTDSIEKP